MTGADWEALRLSAFVGVLAVVLVMPFAAGIAWWLTRREFRGRAVVETALLLPLVLPPVITGYALLVLLGRSGPLGGLLDAIGLPVVFTWRACVIAAAVMAFPLAYRACRTAFEEIDPRLIGAARTLGAGRWDVFRTIVLPLAKRGVVAGAVLAFARSVGEFGATIVLAGNVAGETRTLPLAVFQEVQTDGPAAAWPLAVLCTGLAGGALIASEWLVRRRST